MTFKKLLRVALLSVLFAGAARLDCFAAAITPDSTYNGSLGGFRLLIARFTAATADDGDTWDSNLGTSVVTFWTSHDENPTTQASVGVAAAFASGDFTFYPAEDNMAFTLYVLTR